MDNKVSVSDIDGLKIFKLYEHPEIRPQIEVMKTEVIKVEGKLWNTTKVDSRTLCAVLTNSPNSCPPESLFSIFNETYDDDQKSSYTDYIQLSIQSQFNKRDL